MARSAVVATFWLVRTGISGERFELDSRDLGCGFLLRVGADASQISAQHVIGFVVQLLARTAAYNALETERVPMDNLGRKTQLVSFEFARLDELIQKNSAVALRITESRNESANGRLLVNRDLDKFTLALERVHSRILIDGGSHCLGRGSEQDRK